MKILALTLLLPSMAASAFADEAVSKLCSDIQPNHHQQYQIGFSQSDSQFPHIRMRYIAQWKDIPEDISNEFLKLNQDTIINDYPYAPRTSINSYQYTIAGSPEKFLFIRDVRFQHSRTFNTIKVSGPYSDHELDDLNRYLLRTVSKPIWMIPDLKQDFEEGIFPNIDILDIRGKPKIIIIDSNSFEKDIAYKIALVSLDGPLEHCHLRED